MAAHDERPPVPYTGMFPGTPRPRWAGARWRALAGALCGAACGGWVALSVAARNAGDRWVWGALGGLAGALAGALGGLLGLWLGKKIERGRWLNVLLGYHWAADLVVGLGTVGAILGAALGALRPQTGAVQGWLTGGTLGALSGGVVGAFEYFAGRYGFVSLLGAAVGALPGASLGIIGWAALSVLTVGVPEPGMWPLGAVIGALAGAGIGGAVARRMAGN